MREERRRGGDCYDENKDRKKDRGRPRGEDLTGANKRFKKSTGQVIPSSLSFSLFSQCLSLCLISDSGEGLIAQPVLILHHRCLILSV